MPYAVCRMPTQSCAAQHWMLRCDVCSSAALTGTPLAMAPPALPLPVQAPRLCHRSPRPACAHSIPPPPPPPPGLISPFVSHLPVRSFQGGAGDAGAATSPCGARGDFSFVVVAIIGSHGSTLFGIISKHSFWKQQYVEPSRKGTSLLVEGGVDGDAEWVALPDIWRTAAVKYGERVDPHHDSPAS